MDLIEKINQEIEELNKEISELSALDDDNPTPISPKRKRGRPAIVENKIFVEMWTTALENGSLESIAGSLGISPQSCSVKASNMRKAGHNLPQFKRGRPRKVQ